MIYFPLCGPTAKNLKSSITPYLCGDIKIDKNRYLTKPVSTEDLRQPLRNFYIQIEDEFFSVANPHDSNMTTTVEAGQLWHKVIQKNSKHLLRVEVLNLIPITGDNVELMRVVVTNESAAPVMITPTAAVPLFARSLANKHDHEHVTSLLNRTKQIPQGIVVTPTMRFNEEGHSSNTDVYYVYGYAQDQQMITGSFPTVEQFYGLQGDCYTPAAIVNKRKPEAMSAMSLQGKEAIGALQFKTVTLQPKESKAYFIMTGIALSEELSLEVFKTYQSAESYEQALVENKTYWGQKTDSIQFQTGDTDYNLWMRWVVLQPVLRRIYGCSFLPDHDYGKGGKGWRDIWQDMLSLILIEPQQVKNDLFNNFAGIRIDGSNATIIGSNPGEFIADRNAISRVWMDHGAWPFLTLNLYIHQTGDYDIFLRENSYFKDVQLSRTFKQDTQWDPSQSNELRDTDLKVYKGTIIEHLLIQHLVQFFNVGEHNIIRLENADWNDGLDMAVERGESVAFTCLYAGNLLQIADVLEFLSEQKNMDEISFCEEIAFLLDSFNQPVNYDDAAQKRDRLFKEFFEAVEPHISGKKRNFKIKDVVSDLREKTSWLFEHICKQEKVTVQNHTWFNGYYDNNGQMVEGERDGNIRMTLTGQVFPVMSGVANEEEIRQVVDATNTYLRDKNVGGYHLNTDFKMLHYMELGRAFGFAYGTKENGAFFSHMTVMYAYALYKRGFAREGYEVLQSIYKMCMQTGQSWIYPGIPEYMDLLGRGMYHYLTGSASWLVLTALTQVFGVSGHNGHLKLSPKLVKEEFDAEGHAGVKCYFADKRLNIDYSNPTLLDYDQYTIDQVSVEGNAIEFTHRSDTSVLIDRSVLTKLEQNTTLIVHLVSK